LDPLIKSILEVNGLDEQSIVECVRRLVHLYGFVPIEHFHWAFMARNNDPFGEYSKVLKRARQKFTKYLQAEVVPRVLATDPELVLDSFQIYFQSRAWRDLLWDSRTQGTDYPEDALSEVLDEQWRAAAGKVFKEVLVVRGQEGDLYDNSDKGHSESLSGIVLLFERCSWWSLVCKGAQQTLKKLDTSLSPYDGTTAAAEFERAPGQTVKVIVPMARQWNSQKKSEEINELVRLKRYLRDLREDLRGCHCDFGIHSPRIGDAKWLES